MALAKPALELAFSDSLHRFSVVSDHRSSTCGMLTVGRRSP